MSVGAVGSASQATLGAVTVNRRVLPPPPISFYPGSAAMLLFGGIAMGMGVFFAVSGEPIELCIPFIVIGAGLTAAGIFGLVRRAALLCEFTVHERGVVITRKGSDQLIPYAQVQEFSLREQPRLDNGTYGGMLRTLRFVWPEGRGHVIHFAEATEQDTFGPVVQQVLGKLADAAQGRLGTGASLEGKGWRLDSHGLSVRGQPSLRLGELAGVATFENKVSLWRPGEELPFFSVPDSSPNARLLGALAARELEGRERLQAGELGRLLFQKAVSPFGKVVLGVLSALFVLAGFGTLLMGSILLAAGLWALAVWCASGCVSYFRVHELGVTKHSLLGSHRLRYSEIVSFQFGAVRRYRNGWYKGTRLSMRFTPGPGGNEIHHSQKVHGNDSELEMLREQVSSMVAAQLLLRLSRGEEFDWGSTARFTQKGLLVRSSALLGEEDAWLAPYDAGLRVSIQNGTCQLFVGDEQQAATNIECAEHNFYPGLKVLYGLLAMQSGKPRATG